MNSTRIEEVRVANPKEPLSYDEACRRYAEWCERESASKGVIAVGISQPNRRLSEVVGSSWHLENVNGPLAKVGSNGRVWGPRRENN